MNSLTDTILNIKIKTLDNSLHEFTVTKETSVDDLKNKIAAKINVPVNRQRIIFQGKMLKNHDNMATYKIEDGHVLHLVANPGISQEQERDVSNLATNNNRDGEASPVSDALVDLELISGLIRTLSETTFNRRNLRRRLLQQRTNGFHMDVHESLDTIRQNSQNIRMLLNHTNKPNIPEIGPFNPFNFSSRRLQIGQWVDVKDTIDQWLEAQVINIREGQAFIHYNGWGTRWDEWIDMNSPRIALFRTHTVQSSNTRYMSPFPNNAPDGDNTHLPPQSNIDFIEQLEDTSLMMNNVSLITQKLVDHLNPIQSVGKSEKSEKHSSAKHDIELQNVISGMIEEQKSQPFERARSEKYVQFEDTQSIKSHKSIEKNVMFEDAQSVKSHKSLDYDAISMKSMKSFVSASDIKTMNAPVNFPEYISEEDSEEISEIQSNVNLPHSDHHLREYQIALYASQLAPLYDRFGRLLIDLAPHLAMLGSSIQSTNPTGNSTNHHFSAPVNPNLTFASILTNESGQTNSNPAQPTNRSLNFQVPVMLTPGEVIAANNNSIPSNRIIGENNSNNVEFHIHAVLGPFRNSSPSPHPPQNTHHNHGSSPLRNLQTRSEILERRRGTNSSVSEQPERRVSYQPIQQAPREADQISLERENLTPSIKEKEEENLNEISFGTRRSLEPEIENNFGESNILGQGAFSQRENDVEQALKNSLTDQINPFHGDEGPFTQEQRNEHQNESKNNPEKDDDNNNEKEQDYDDSDDWDNNNSNPRHSNCGRNIS